MSILVNDSENMDKDFTIRQKSTRPKKQPIELNKTGAMSKDIRTFFNKERNVLARNCIEKKNHCNRLIFKFESFERVFSRDFLQTYFANIRYLIGRSKFFRISA